MTEEDLMKDGGAAKRTEASAPAEEVKEDLGKTREFQPAVKGALKDILKEKTRRIPTEEIARERFRFLRRKDRQQAELDQVPEEPKQEEPVLPNEEDIIHAADAVSVEDAQGAAAAEPAAGMQQAVESAGMEAGEETAAETAEETAQENAEETVQDAAEEMTAEEAGEPAEEPAEEEAPEEEPLDEEDILPPDIRPLFYGFTETPGIEKQISDALWQAIDRGEDRTSRSGNILILGPHCSGKTTLAMNLAKAVAQEKGNESMKIAKIYAADFNRKDIASTIAKIAGGTLIIEEAGDLEPAAIEQLTTAMEFRTDQLLVILEDEQQYIHDLLMKHPRFTMKFTSQIYLPVYGAEELLNFAQLFAGEQDCVISEDGEERYGRRSRPSRNRERPSHWRTSTRWSPMPSKDRASSFAG